MFQSEEPVECLTQEGSSSGGNDESEHMQVRIIPIRTSSGSCCYLDGASYICRYSMGFHLNDTQVSACLSPQKALADFQGGNDAETSIQNGEKACVNGIPNAATVTADPELEEQSLSFGTTCKRRLNGERLLLLAV